MNERIQQLAEQARQYAIQKIENSQDPTEWSTVMFEQKFAELIVRECMNVAVYKSDGMIFTADVAGHQAAGRECAAKMIKQHFGVE
jgi:hypothetical protein